MPSDYPHTIRAVADDLGVSRQRVWQIIQAGHIPAECVDYHPQLSRVSAEGLEAAREYVERWRRIRAAQKSQRASRA